MWSLLIVFSQETHKINTRPLLLTNVFISESNGYITQYIINDLLDSEKYRVIGSVRSQKKVDKIILQSDLSLEVVPDITKLDSFNHVFEKYGQEIKVVLHTNSYHGKDVLPPVNNGTKSILETIKK